MSNNVFFGNYDLNCFEIAFDPDKYATRYYEKAFKLPSGVHAEILIKQPNINDKEIIDDTLKTNIVPAKTPCLLHADEVKTYKFWFDETNTDKAPEPNYFHGVTKRTRVYDLFPPEKYTILVLITNKNGDDVEWVSLRKPNGTVGANRIFIPVQI